MINEERVKEMYRMAVYDEYDEKKYRSSGEYYCWDYIGRELVKSFFSGTIAYVLFAVLLVLRDLTSFLTWINGADWVDFGMRAVMIYIGFMAAYLLITALIYILRYEKGRAKLRRYAAHLKRARRLARDER